jgi:L-ascorbate metabolism protein UlaG (beta-lactamase superfamily)
MADFFLEALPETKRLQTYALPTTTPDWAAINAPQEQLQALWLGHASFLFQAAGFNFLTDPVFSKRASPFQFMGPARYTPPPCSVRELPPVHVVLISHNHYDHIDAGTIRALLEKEAEDAAAASAAVRTGGSLPSGHRPYAGTLYVCPLRVAPLLHSLGVARERIVELDWWDTYVPAPVGPLAGWRAAGAAAAGSGPCARQSINPVAAKGSIVKAPPEQHVYDAHVVLGPEAAAAHGHVDADAAAAGHEGTVHAHAEHGTDEEAHEAAAAPHAAHGALAEPHAHAPELPDYLAGMPRIACVPAQHQSARTLFDRNRSLWCGYAVVVPTGHGAAGAGADSSAATTHNQGSSSDVRFYFTGDTGYRAVAKGIAPLSAEEAAVPRCPAFKAIGERYGPFDLAALPIGAYSPRFFMSSFHASPEDAVDMHRDVRSRRSVGMHWAVFPLTDEPIEEPPARLSAALRHHGVPQQEFVAVIPGALVGARAGPHDAAHVMPAAQEAAPAVGAAAAKAPTAAAAAVVPLKA